MDWAAEEEKGEEAWLIQADTLNETVPGPGLQKPVHAAISQAARSTQNPAPYKIWPSIPSTTRALPGGRLLVGCSAKKRENRTSGASQCQLSFLLLPAQVSSRKRPLQSQYPCSRKAPPSPGLIYHHCF